MYLDSVDFHRGHSELQLGVGIGMMECCWMRYKMRYLCLRWVAVLLAWRLLPTPAHQQLRMDLVLQAL